jgi:hypothetical protein
MESTFRIRAMSNSPPGRNKRDLFDTRLILPNHPDFALTTAPDRRLPGSPRFDAHPARVAGRRFSECFGWVNDDEYD